jgi:hypothetical protein
MRSGWSFAAQHLLLSCAPASCSLRTFESSNTQPQVGICKNLKMKNSGPSNPLQLSGQRACFRGVGNPHLLKNILPVPVYRVDAYEKRFRNFFAPFS